MTDPAPEAASQAPEAWRIDDLARAAGITVDTVRFYVREGLLPPGEKQGRHRVYGPDHAERVARIRELQDRRFSLAAIKALLETDRPGLEDLFASHGRTRSFTDLVNGSGLDADLVTRLQDVGLLADPGSLGHEAYDDDDLGLLRAVAELASVVRPPTPRLATQRDRARMVFAGRDVANAAGQAHHGLRRGPARKSATSRCAAARRAVA